MPHREDVEAPVLPDGRTDDCLVGLAVLLPAEPQRPIMLAAGPEMVVALQRRFPGALVHGSDPVPDEVGFLLADSTAVDATVVQELRARVTPTGATAVIGDDGPHLVYPHSGHPEHLWRWGWPLPEVHGTGAQVRRTVGILAAKRRGVPRLRVDGAPGASLADRIATDLGAALGASVDLVGVVTAGQTILRFRSEGRHLRSDVAVRLSFDPDEAHLAIEDQVIRDVPAVARFVAPRLAVGRTDGLPWVASAWVPRRRHPLIPVRRRRRIDDVMEQLVTELERVPTGKTFPGWSTSWIEGTSQLPPEAADRLTPVLATLDRGLPTGWSHGDLWGANVLCGEEQGVVIDWDNADRHAPLGIDRLLMAALHQGDVASGCRRIVDDSGFTPIVAGRRWWDWDRDTRIGLAVAAYLLHLRNRSSGDLSRERLDADLTEIGALLRPEGPMHHSVSEPIPSN